MAATSLGLAASLQLLCRPQVTLAICRATVNTKHTLNQCYSNHGSLAVAHRYYRVYFNNHRNINNSLRASSVVSCCNADTSLFVPKRNAGHSKWQNIRHTKAAKDDVKRQNADQILAKIRLAVKASNGVTNPKLNSRLAVVMEEGKKKAVPNTTMLDFLKKLEKNQDMSQKHFIEVKGPGQVLLIFDVMTPHLRKTKSEIQGIVKKFGAKVGDKKGFATYGYDFIGSVLVDKEEIVDLEKAEEIAIECEAEDVTEEEEDGEKIYRFLCPPESINQVAGKIRKENIQVREACEEYVPHTFVTMTPELEAELHRMFDKLHSIEAIQRIFDNIEVPQDS